MMVLDLSATFRYSRYSFDIAWALMNYLFLLPILSRILTLSRISKFSSTRFDTEEISCSPLFSTQRVKNDTVGGGLNRIQRILKQLRVPVTIECNFYISTDFCDGSLLADCELLYKFVLSVYIIDTIAIYLMQTKIRKCTYSSMSYKLC